MFDVGGIDTPVDLPGRLGDSGCFDFFPHTFGTRKIDQRPDDDGHGHDDRSGADEKLPRALPHAPQNIAESRGAVGRHLEEKRLRPRAENEFVQRPSHGHGDGQADEVHGEQSEAGDARTVGRLDKGADHEHINRQARGTTHERRNKDRGQAGPRILDGAGGEHAGNGASVTRKHGHEAFAVQPAPSEHFVHKERAARHVARVFEERDEKEEDENLRKKDDHAADAADDAVDDEALQDRPAAEQRRDERLDRSNSLLDPPHERTGPRVDRLKDDKHHGDEDDQAPHAVGQHRIDAFGPRSLPFFRKLDRSRGEMPYVFVAEQSLGRKRLDTGGGENVARGGEQWRGIETPRDPRALEDGALSVEHDATQFAIGQRADTFFFQSVAQIGDGAADRLGPRHLGHASTFVDGAVDRFFQRVDPLTFRRHGAHDRHAEVARKKLRVDADSRFLRGVGHIERDDQRQTEVGDLRGEEKIAHQVRGIDHADDRIGRGFSSEMAGEKIEGDAFVGRGRGETVGSGQVDKFDAAAAALPRAGFFFHGDARIVPDLLPRAGQTVEERGFARVRIADQGNPQNGRGKRRGLRHFEMRGFSVHALDFHRGGIRFTQTEPHSVEFDFDRVAQRRDLHHLHGSAGQKPEGQEALEGGMVGRTGTNPSAFAGPQGGQRTSRAVHRADFSARCCAFCRAQTKTQPSMQRRRAMQPLSQRTMTGSHPERTSTSTPSRKPARRRCEAHSLSSSKETTRLAMCRGVEARLWMADFDMDLN